MLRRIFTKAMKAYGPGIADLEYVMQETIKDMIDDIHQKDSHVIDAAELSTGYVCCVIASMVSKDCSPVPCINTVRGQS